MTLFFSMTTVFADLALEPVQEAVDQADNSPVFYIFVLLLVVLIVSGLIILRIVKKNKY